MVSTAPAKLVYRHVTRRFGRILAVDGVSLEVTEGEILALLGPSGSGKTTLLAMTGGQLAPDDGDILIDGKSIVGLPPNKVDTATVFQEYALFPHLTVAQNIGFGLYMRRIEKRSIADRVDRMLDLVGLQGLGERKVTELSGGQRQRVATARALAVEPSILLLDEPLSALDREIRKRLQEELADLLRSLGVTAVIVTHDQDEAFAMADRIAVMNNGKLEQVGIPSALYRTPATPFVATFLGSGELLDGVAMSSAGDSVMVTLPGATVPCRGTADNGERVTVLIRGEDVLLEPAADSGVTAGWSDGHIVRVVDGGGITSYRVELAGSALTAVELGLRRYEVGQMVKVGLRTDGPVIVTGNSDHETV